MGVDTSIKVRIYTNNQTEYKEVTVSDQDNSLGSLFFNSEISYTSIQFDRKNELTDKENEVLNLEESDEEMLAVSRIINAKEVDQVVERMYNKMYREIRLALHRDLNDISALDTSDDEKSKKQKSKIGDYFDFENSFSIFRGIIKAASEEDQQIQIVLEFY